MSEPENLILRQLRSVDAKLDDTRDRVAYLKTRMTAQEQHIDSLVVALARSLKGALYGAIIRAH